MTETIVLVWVLSVQLWTDPPPKIKIIYNKEFATYNECMEARKDWDTTKFQALCFNKIKK